MAKRLQQIQRLLSRVLRPLPAGGVNYLLMALIYAFLYLPIGLLVINSFNASKYGIRWQGFSWQWYERLLANHGLLEAAWHSLLVGVLSATCATIIGSLAAVALLRFKFRSRPLIAGLLFALMMVPEIVMAVSLLVLFLLVGIQLGFWSLLLAHITFCLPFVVVAVYSRIRDFDPNILLAAKDLGASEWVIFRQILLPMSKTAVAAGWLMAFTLSLDDVIISSFVTGPTFEILPIKIYSMVRVGISPEVNALATLLLVLSLTLVGVSLWLLRRRSTLQPGS